jgi:cytochrome b involved in lipid metabolism
MKIYAIATGAAVALALVVAPSASAAAKEGAACKKAGQTSTVSGRKFTCVKKGSKLVWNKGVVVKKAPSVAATPAASAAPAMSATPMATKSAEPSKSAEPTKSAAPASTGYTMERVKANGTTSMCWAVISGNVYDLTKWIGSHPGGSGAIASLCGTDGTSEFLAMHRGQNKPEARLAGYLLGPLAK